MKKESSIKNTIDVLSTLLQTIILAIIPVVLEDLIKWQIVSYCIIFVLHVFFMIFVRERLIRNIILARTIDIGKIQNENLIKIFKKEIVPNTFEIKKTDKDIDETDRYYLFLKWKETTELVVSCFTSEFINEKLVKKKETSFSNRKIYKKDLQVIVNILINSYTLNKAFSQIVDDYKCRTLRKDIDDLYEKLLKIKKSVD